MADITMDLDDLLEERQNQFENGLRVGTEAGISLVMKWLEGKERLYDFLHENGYTINERAVQGSHWHRIAKSLGREEEMNKIFT